LIADTRLPADVAPTLNAAFGEKQGLEDQHALGGAGLFVAHAIQAGALRENPASGPDGVGIQADIAYTLEARAEVQAVARALRGEGFDASEDGTGRGTPLVPVSVALRGRDGGATAELGDDKAHALRASQGGGDKPHVLAFSAKDHGGDAGDTAPTLRAMGHAGSHANGGGQVAVAVDVYNQTIDGDVTSTLNAESGAPNHSGPKLLHAMQVRRLTPTECARLQGFPDNWTQIPWRGRPASECPDGPQYRAYGNSMAVPVMRWIGERIAMVEKLREGSE